VPLSTPARQGSGDGVRRDLSCSPSLLPPKAQEAHAGFEPVLREDDDDPSLGREPPRPASELPADLQRIVERLTKRRGVSEPRD
jgi:hypothetical protein